MWLKEKKNPCEIAVKKLKSASFLNQFCTLCMNLHNPIDFELCLNKYKVSLRPIMRHNFTIISFVWDCCFNGNQGYMYLRDHFDFFIRHIYAILKVSRSPPKRPKEFIFLFWLLFSTEQIRSFGRICGSSLGWVKLNLWGLVYKDATSYSFYNTLWLCTKYSVLHVNILLNFFRYWEHI